MSQVCLRSTVMPIDEMDEGRGKEGEILFLQSLPFLTQSSVPLQSTRVVENRRHA
jgi:hypothetical protein